MNRNQGPSDFYILHGAPHRCACGQIYTDSDGGPCHGLCPRCEKNLISEDDGVSNVYPLGPVCQDCADEIEREKKEEEEFDEQSNGF